MSDEATKLYLNEITLKLHEIEKHFKNQLSGCYDEIRWLIDLVEIIGNKVGVKSEKIQNMKKSPMYPYQKNIQKAIEKYCAPQNPSQKHLEKCLQERNATIKDQENKIYGRNKTIDDQEHRLNNQAISIQRLLLELEEYKNKLKIKDNDIQEKINIIENKNKDISYLQKELQNYKEEVNRLRVNIGIRSNTLMGCIP